MVGPVWNPWELAMVDSAIIVPPVSDRERAKQRMMPVTRPARNRGRVMVRAAVNLLAPSVWPAVS